MKRSLAIAGIAFYILLLALVSAKLFFEESFDSAVRFLRAVEESGAAISIGLAEPFANVSPLANDAGSRARLAHIFEPLVAINRELSPQPRLAISYGRLNETEWEFKLRPAVVFHDGTPMTRADVLASLQAARSESGSQLRDYLVSVKKIEETGEDSFIIHTSEPDPLLPQKLSFIPIYKAGGRLIGTGPYVFQENANGTLRLGRFDSYWGPRPYYKEVVISTHLTKESKLEALAARSVDILASIPADEASRFEQAGFTLVTRPSLEVNFLLVKPEGSLAPLELRHALRMGINTSLLARFGHGFTQEATQFAPNGVFGFDPEITKIPFDPVKAKERIGSPRAATGIFPKGLETPAQTIQKMLANIGITLEIEFLSPEEVAARMASAPADLTFFGWRFDLGDAADFLQAVAHSKTQNAGQFNVGYRNAEVDSSLEQSQTALESGPRLRLLRRAMQIITEEDPIGVPLWTPELLYAVRDGIRWEPRVDGYILAQEGKK